MLCFLDVIKRYRSSLPFTVSMNNVVHHPMPHPIVSIKYEKNDNPFVLGHSAIFNGLLINNLKIVLV